MNLHEASKQAKETARKMDKQWADYQAENKSEPITPEQMLERITRTSQTFNMDGEVIHESTQVSLRGLAEILAEIMNKI